MKTIIRTVGLTLAVAALCGCGVPKEEHQKTLDELAAANSKLARASQDIQALRAALDQKDAEVAGVIQQFQQQKTAYEALIRRQAALIKSPATTPTKPATPPAKGKAPAKKPGSR